MAKLSYKTVKNVSPQGKERVYFTCHPDDVVLYFDSICEEIFRTQNCAIWYKEDPDVEWPARQMERELGRMQLFVIPVTAKFLYQDNIARNEEFRFAMEHHIPVLPLIEEPGLESEFNRICGDLQLLDKTARDNDVTAIPYEKKLEDFLASVLLGDDLAEKVRNAFDAYIFLSYRKKDREFAQELMRLIHRNDFCRDIAIWYDEFLVPGEEFNQAIREAMNKSDLFTFVVTPNILEKGNYVMTTEYPVAVEEQKPILPAEMIDTDRELLRERFENIPEPTDVYDQAAFSKALLSNLHELAMEENNNDPAHLFFIGLAYLNGIDVEEDRERGVRLIKTAAEADIPEAIEKLFQMFQTGDGVELDFEQAGLWQEKLANYWEKQFAESEAKADALKFMQIMEKIVLFWGDLENYEKSREEANRLLEFSEKEINELGTSMFKTLEYQQEVYFCYDMLGLISQRERHYSEAEAWAKRQVEYLKKLNLKVNGNLARRNLFVVFGRLGDIYMVEGKLPEAKKYYQKSLDEIKRFSRIGRSKESLAAMACAYDRLGNLSKEEENLSEAERWHKKSLEIWEKLNEEKEDVNAQTFLIVSYERLGHTSQAEGHYAEAEQYFRQALKLADKLARETGTLIARRNLKVCYMCLGDLYREKEAFREAREWYKKGLKLSEELDQEAKSINSLDELGFAYERMGLLLRKEGSFDEAEQWYKKCLDAWKKVNREASSTELRRRLGLVYCHLGDLCSLTEKMSEAKDWYREGARLREEVNHEACTAASKTDLALVYEALGFICMAENEMDGAEEWYRKGLGLREELDQESHTADTQENVAACCDSLGDVCKEEERLNEAKEWFLKSIKRREQVSGVECMANSRTNLNHTYESMGLVFLEEGDFVNATEWFQKCLKLRQELDQEDRTAGTQDELAICYFNLGYVSKEEGQLGIAKEYFQKGLAISEKLYHETGDVKYSEDIADFHNNLGEMNVEH